MSNEVYANNMEVSCKAAAGKSICCFPDVCFTPPLTPATPPGVPIPYPNTGMASDCTDGSSTVRISGEEVMLKNKSYFKKSTGDEAGCAPKKGIINSKIMGKVYFNAWSMDVNVEGENVVRNLDLTTHNHGTRQNGAVPWPYADAVAMAVEGHPCKEMAEQIKHNCKGGKDKKGKVDHGMDYSSECCKARKCLLVPYAPNTCCNAPGTDERMTPHHVLPSNVFVTAKARPQRDRTTKYKSNAAPCICVEGKTHSKGFEHGQVGCHYTVLRNKWLKDPANFGKPFTLAVGYDVAARSAAEKVNADGANGCDAECLKKQLEQGHKNMELKLAEDDALPRARQPEGYL